TGSTTPGRSKEEAQDYRYFPEPDLVPVAPAAEWVEELRAALPELPAARRARLQAEWGLSDTDMTWLNNPGPPDLVAEAVAAGAPPAEARKWWLGELSRRAHQAGTELAAPPVPPAAGAGGRGARAGWAGRRDRRGPGRRAQGPRADPRAPGLTSRAVSADRAQRGAACTGRGRATRTAAAQAPAQAIAS